MRVEKNPKTFAYRVPRGDYNYLQCVNRLKTQISRVLFLEICVSFKNYPRMNDQKKTTIFVGPHFISIGIALSQ